MFSVGTNTEIPFEHFNSTDGKYRFVHKTEHTNNASARFHIDAEGCLIWEDHVEHAAEGTQFMKLS